MVVWTRLLGEYDAVSDTFSALAGGAGASPYTPDKTGTLKKLTCIVNRDAATSLIDHVEFRLTSTTFDPNTIEVGAQGAGLQTALVPQAGMAATNEWEVDQAVQAGVPITIEARNVGADTQVTVSVLIYGTFEA